MKEIEDLVHTMARLRGPDGCPWDREQDHRSLTRHLLEEAAELIDTIERDDMEHMREELGDLLLQVVFHAQMAAEQGHFTFAEVAAEINAKLIRRHPHVFGELDLTNSAEVLVEWERIKGEEKEGRGTSTPTAWDDIPPSLPALLLADKVWKRKEQKKDLLPEEFAGHWDAEKDLAAKQAVQTEEDWGRKVFFLLGQARQEGWDPEGALRRYTRSIMEKGKK